MGCALSRSPVNDASDGVLKKCKQRMILIENAINHRKDFAVAHVLYVESLAKVGLALKQFTEGEYAWVASSPPRALIFEPPQLALTTTKEVPDLSSASNVSPLPSNISKDIIDDGVLQKDSSSVGSSPISPIQSPSMALTPFPISEGSSPQEEDRIHDIISPLRRAESLPELEYDDDYDYDDSPPRQPPVLVTDSSWFSYGTFTPPVIPEHLKEQRQMKKFDVNGSVTHMQDDEGTLNLDNEDMVASEEISYEEQEVRENGRKRLEIVALDKNVEESFSDQTKTEPIIHGEMKIAESIMSDNTDTELNGMKSFSGENLPHIMEHIDKLFARASKCGQDVSMMLEMKSHQHVKNSFKTFNAITSYWSSKTSIMIEDMHEDNEILGGGMAGSQFSTLERLYAWERKLYDEVDGSEHILKEFNQKCKQLHILESNSADMKEREEVRATVKRLDTRLTVAFKAIQVTSAKIQDLANDELFPQLCELLEGLIKMWKMMQECHNIQRSISAQLQKLQHSVEDVASNNGSDSHKTSSAELRHELEVWRKNFQVWISTQKKYVSDICRWLESCYSNEPNMKNITEEMHTLGMMKEWENSIGNLVNVENVSESIGCFIATFPFLEMSLLDELRFKKQLEWIRKSLDEQSLILQKLEREHTEEIPNSETGSNSKSKLKKVRTRVDKFKNDIGNHESKHSKAVEERKIAMLDILKQHLPPLFNSLSLFAQNASDMYQKIRYPLEKDSSNTQMESQIDV